MRLIEHKGKRAYLTEKEVKSLIKRFDPDKGWIKMQFVVSVSSISNETIIMWKDESCILCKKYNCEKCPLGIWGGKRYSDCTVLLKAIGILGYRNGIRIFDDHLMYFWGDGRQVKNELKKIQNALINLPKVKRRKTK